MDTDTALSERARHLLRVLIERFINEGTPVGSRTLARSIGHDLSPASIRNVMADLEEMGLVMSPHTSAGRVPTVKGYRFFVDSILKAQPMRGPQVLQLDEVARLEEQLRQEGSTEDMLEAATAVLSNLTQMAGLVMLPRIKRQELRQIEFLPLSDNRVLAILVINEKEVQNRVIETTRVYSASDLQQAANYLNQAFAGRTIEEVRQRLVDEMQEVKEGLGRMMQAAVDMANRVFDSAAGEGDYIIAGETNLMGFAELSDVERLRGLFEAFNEKRDILHLLDQCVNARGVQILIGNESGHKALDACSVVTSSYQVDGEVAGVLGVIGPTRMAYKRVIPIVDLTARLLGAALNQRH